MDLDYSKITDWLMIGRTPDPEDYPRLYEEGVRLVINMRVERRPKPNPHSLPIELLWLPSFDSPLIPIPMRALEKGANAALETIAEGGKVYTHCQAGVHRGVAMGAAILIAQGYSPEEAMALIQEKREPADPKIWYIRRRIMRFARRWEKRDDGEWTGDGRRRTGEAERESGTVGEWKRTGLDGGG